MAKIEGTFKPSELKAQLANPASPITQHARRVAGGNVMRPGVYEIAADADITEESNTFNGNTTYDYIIVAKNGMRVSVNALMHRTCSDAESKGTDVLLKYVNDNIVAGCNTNVELAIKLAQGGTLTVSTEKTPYYSTYRAGERLPEGRVRKIGMTPYASWETTVAAPAAE